LAGITPSCPFQSTGNPFLKKRLQEILKNKENKNCLIGILSPNREWCFNLYEKNQTILEYLNYDLIYANSLISRYPREVKLKEYRKIWENKKVVFVYSLRGKFKIIPLLFDNIKEYETIDIPSSDAFEKYDEIFEKCKKYSKEYLFIIAAGSTATVLAFDLSLLGYQAIDIGHLPNCYVESRTSNIFFKVYFKIKTILTKLR
jgi:hypothetical protein